MGLFEPFTGVGFKALEKCIFNLWALTVFMREIGYPLPKSMSVIKFNSFLIYGSEQILSTPSTRDINTPLLTCGGWLDLKWRYLLLCVGFLFTAIDAVRSK